MMSPDTMTSTQDDPQDMTNMDTSESDLPLDDVSSSAEDKLKRRNPFDDDDDDDEGGKHGINKDSPETPDEKPINDFSENRLHKTDIDTSQNMEHEISNEHSSDDAQFRKKSSGEKSNISSDNEDVAAFDGRIVYNPDGSAYIIEDEAGDDSELQLPRQEGSTVVDCSRDNRSEPNCNDLPAIANAFFVSKSTAYFNALYGRAYVKMLQDKNVPETPICHSYRVYSAKDKSEGATKTPMPSSLSSLPNLVPVKPILMCFICKLSFGCSKSFASHCIETHSLELSSEERNILDPSKNSSAIVQSVGKEQEIRVSFLEPVTSSSSAPILDHSDVAIAAAKAATENKQDSPIIPGAISNLLAAVAASASGLPSSTKDSLLLSQPSSKEGSEATSVDAMGPPSLKLLQQLQAQHHHLISDESSTSLHLPLPPLSSPPTQHSNSSNSPPSLTGRSNSLSPAACGGANTRYDSPSPSLLSNQSASQQFPSLPHLSLIPQQQSHSNTPTNANMLQGTTIGACPEHINGRPTGVECVKCDLIISSSRMAGGSNWNMSRNSCKTLKCPKCNWHYKYQETLEIHMKEKHPESETTCIYCITGQQHPRLARGETYTCGYKPYKCEVCNYSTTTKGNLSIHMQSDKHLNNMQEIQATGGPLPSSSSTTEETNNSNTKIPPSSPSISSSRGSNSGLLASSQSQSMPPITNNSTISPSKLPQQPLSLNSHLPTSMPPLAPVSPQQKPNWRCDVCNYETNVARNLRIHMTSEKHTHNMMALQQQNVKNMQNLSASLGVMGHGGMNPSLGGLSDPKQLLSLLAGMPQLGSSGNSASANGQPEAALADLAFNQAVLAQLMSGVHAPGMPSASLPKLPPSPFMALQPNMPPEFNLAAALTQASTNSNLPGLMPLGNLNTDDHSPLEPPPEPTDQNPKHLFTCCVCRSFDCDGLEELSGHLSQDRSRTREHEVSIVIAGNYLCQLCNYKTNLKANFQLHCKTDKHLQRLSHVNHIKEGGPSNEWKLRFLTSINPVELRCNSCEFYSNSPHKLQVHTSGQQHQVSALLFAHLQRMESSYGKGDGDGLLYNCALCKFSAKGKHGLLAHVRTMQHLQMEQIHQLQKRAEGNLGQTDIGDIFQVLEPSNESGRKTPSSIAADDDDIRESNYTGINNKSKIDDDNDSIAESNPADNADPIEHEGKQCPLCQENFKSQNSLNEHALSVHSVNAEGLARLQSLINGSHWLNNKQEKENSQHDERDSLRPSSTEKDGDGIDSADETESKRARMDNINSSPNGSGNMGSGSNGGYSMEKYLDPNRPFKCEVCKESFTQKNILLVHYNSVSHLHRLKKSLDGQGKHAITENQPTPEKTPTKGSALEALLGNLGNRGLEKGSSRIGSIGTEEEEYKPFKCNICKVAYAQGSTLDIHVRSVLHQTKASKLQELILTGQIDMNKPLIEQPDALSLQEQHKKMINDMLSPKSLNSTGSSGPQTSPTTDSGRLNRTSSPSQRSSTPQSSPLATMMMNMKQQQQQGPSTGGNSSDSSPPLELPKSTGTTLPVIPRLPTSSPLNIDQKSSAPSPVLKNLLQNYGIDFAKQFGNNKLNSDGNDNDDLMDNKSEKDHRGTPSSVISNGAADRSTSRASASETNENGSKTTTPQKLLSPPDNTPVVPEGLQEALRNAMMNAQLQQTLNNPLMMQMAQLSGGLNPLMAMNLHPPLIPPNLLNQGNNGGVNDNTAALLAQMFGTGSTQSLPAQQFPTMSPGMDPKLFALMQASRQMQANESKDLNENKNQLAQMMSLLQGGKGPADMLSQFHPDPNNLLQLASKMGLSSSKHTGVTLPQNSPSGGMKEKHQSHIAKQSQHPFTAPTPPGLGGNQLPPGLSHSPMPDSSLLMQQQAVSGGASQHDSKRARTRISDDQLKILRSNFDINNSPAEESLNTMAQQTGLPLKVIKHWFRNTLFKERQKNKDSPYNFANPPSTKLNLEEYEKTGESKVTALNPDDQAEYGIQQDKHSNSDVDTIKRNCDSPSEEPSSMEDVKNEMKFEESPDPPQKDNSLFNALANSKVPSFLTDSLQMAGSDDKGVLSLSRLLALGAGGASINSNMPSLLPNFPAFPSLNLPPCTTSAFTSAFPNLPVTSASFSKLNLPSVTSSGLQLPASPVMPDQLNSILSKQHQQRPLSPQSVSSQGKRANRTRFTDYQIKVLQEFFENNAYPKDDDLEYLSKLLGLSPRVIVVWFQNARQKARKVYENQPADGSSPNGTREGGNSGAEDEAAGRFTRTSSCNYQCKKCLLVFQRYYELIRHQKQHCYKEEDAKKSAQAQKAAAVAAAQFQGSTQTMNYSDDSNDAGGKDYERTSISSPARSRSSEGGGEHTKGDENRYSTEDRIQSIQHQRNFEVEEAISKLMHPLSGLGAYPSDSPFGILQQQGLVPLPQHPIRSRSPLTNDGNDGDLSGDDFLDSESGASSGGGGAAMTTTPNREGKKRKHSLDDCEDAEGCDDLTDEALLHKDKRLRTTILPEQLDFLYQKYQVESNPSRKMLEQIAGDVGLRKRVVQVWFQNTRARERKGHFRPSQQFISKKCPFCASVFKVRAALEAHLTSKHPDQPTSIVDIDALPNVNSDGIVSHEEVNDDVERIDEKRRNSINNSNSQRPVLAPSPFTMSEQIANLLPTGGSNAFDLQTSMRKYYEDTMKRFMNDLGDASKRSAESMIPKSPQSITSPIMPSAPVDLTATYTFEDSIDDNQMGGDASDSDGHNRSVDADGNLLQRDNKRFRTQMSGLQIKMMKAVFEVYKTPTMTECSNLGKDIGLQKRVVQVWFQNARAKEKRAKLQLQQATGGRDSDIGASLQPPTPERCIVCPDFSYTEGKGCAVQDHIFTRNHLENLKMALEQGRYEPEAPGNFLSQAAVAISGGNNGVLSSTSSPPPTLSSNIPPSTRDNNALQMLQMATQSATKASSNTNSLANELMEMSSMQNGRMLMQV